MNDKEIDEVLKTAGQHPEALEPALLHRLAEAIRPSLQPVRPLPSTWLLISGLVFVSAAIGVAGAARAGFSGIAKLSFTESLLIFPALAILMSFAAIVLVNEMIPGSPRRISSSGLLGVASVALLCLFGLLFSDHRTDHFLHAGIICLVAGVLHALPAAILSWLLLRRGFAVNPVAAGLVAGTLGGLAGVLMLELHCANLQALHVLVWHTAVVPVSATVGALSGWMLRFLRNA